MNNFPLMHKSQCKTQPRLLQSACTHSSCGIYLWLSVVFTILRKLEGLTVDILPQNARASELFKMDAAKS